jgi:hypothetical protein
LASPASSFITGRFGSSTRARSFMSRPMRKPVFTETLQIAIVGRDLEAAMRTYVDDYWIGP